MCKIRSKAFKGVLKSWVRLLILPGAIFLILFCGCGKEAENSARKKLVVATDATMIPMVFMTDDNRIDGFEMDLMKAIAGKAGFEWEMINVEWAGLFGGLITRKYDMAISSITILDERKKRMAFSIPYLKSGIALVVRKEMEGVHSLEDVKTQNLLVGAQIGTTAYFFLEKDPDIRKKGYQMYGHAVTNMINGNIDAVIGESTGTLYYKNQNLEYFRKIKMVGEIMTKEFYGIAMKKDDPELLEKVNGALRVLLENGAIQALHDKWELGQAASVPSLEEAGAVP